eukprot:355292-Chlamydomonas_euryale.AAC.7
MSTLAAAVRWAVCGWVLVACPSHEFPRMLALAVNHGQSGSGALPGMHAQRQLQLARRNALLQLWTAQPPPAEWIRRGQLAHTPPQRPPGAERKGRNKGRSYGPRDRCHVTDTT